MESPLAAVPLPVFFVLVGSSCVLAVLAAVAGTGGGSLFLPLFSLPLADVHDAVPLSKTAVLGTGLGACLINYWKARSSQDLVNYRIVTLIQPATLLGCLVGVLLNLWFPSMVITCSMVLILSLSAWKTFDSARKMQTAMANTADFEPLLQVSSQYDSSKAPSDPNTPPRSLTPPVISTAVSSISEDGASSRDFTAKLLPDPLGLISPDSFGSPHQKLLYTTAQFFGLDHNAGFIEPEGLQLFEVAQMVFCWLVNLTCLWYAGSAAAVICGNRTQKMWMWADIVFLSAFIAFTYSRLSRLRSKRGSYALRWLTPKTAASYCLFAFLAGVSAALLGIGGGLIKSPLLIAIGLRPVSAVATSSYMIIFTSSTNVVLYMLAGRLQPKDLSYFAPMTLVGGLVGVVCLRKYFVGTSTQHILARVLGWTILFGGIAMLGASLFNRFYRHVSDERTFAEACVILHERAAS